MGRSGLALILVVLVALGSSSMTLAEDMRHSHHACSEFLCMCPPSCPEHGSDHAAPGHHASGMHGDHGAEAQTQGPMCASDGACGIREIAMSATAPTPKALLRSATSPSRVATATAVQPASSGEYAIDTLAPPGPPPKV